VNDEESDEALMLAYAAGNAQAFERLYARLRKPLYGFLMRGLQDRVQADECFQDVWTRVIAARQRYQPEARFSTWLFQIAHHRMIDVWRRQRPETSLETQPEAGLARADDDAGRPEDAAGRFQQQRRLQEALKALPPEQRIALQLRLQQELSLEEIAEVTGSGRETVKSRLRYAMDKLRRTLGADS
jgi:RNA polymerase sigma-70 factor (ECF subfamily)